MLQFQKVRVVSLVLFYTSAHTLPHPTTKNIFNEEIELAKDDKLLLTWGEFGDV